MATVFGVPLLYVLIILFLSLPRVTPFNVSYPAIFNFGDSNSDTGALAAAFAYSIESPNGETFFLKPSGRLCDGRMIIDFFAEAMGIPFLHPYLDSLGAPSFHTGCNFAIGGSTINPATSTNIRRSPFSFNDQVTQFILFKRRALQMLATDDQHRILLPSEDYFKQGVYMFDIGQNDLDFALHENNWLQVLRLFPKILSAFEAGLERLYTEGARNFWIHNVRPLGCLPRIIYLFGKDDTSTDEHGCVISHNSVAINFNQQLKDLCTKFRNKYPDVQLIYNDIYRIMQNLILNYTNYGFKQNVGACCGHGTLPLNIDTRIRCGQTMELDTFNVTAGSCNNAAEYVNWDGSHYTEAANKFAFSAILTGNYSEPPLPSEFALFLKSKLNI